MMLELVQVLVLTVLCSSTQATLVPVSGNEATCSDAVVFWCTSELGFLIWEISTLTRSDLTFSINNGTMRLHLMPDSSLVVAQVTFNNGSFINGTVTIMRPINLTGMISCNQDSLILNVLANTGPLPTSLNISKIEPGNMLDIHWISEGNGYCIQSSHLRYNGSWSYAATGSYTLPWENKTCELTISLHPVMNMASNFTIGPCLYNDQLIMERNYTLYQNGTWTVFQECNNSRLQFNARCGSSGSWTTNMSSSAMNDNHTTSTQGTTRMSETTKSSPVKKGQSQILNSSLITIGVLIILAVIVAIICFRLIGKRKKKKSSREYPAQAEFSEMTYQQLSNKHFHHKPNTSGRQIPSVETEMHDQGEYSSLHHNKPFLPSSDEYATITNTHQPETAKRDFLEYGSSEAKNTTSIAETSCSTSHPAHTKTKKLQYIDVDTPGHNDPMGCDLIRIKVDYADINLRARPEDETLNLDSLLIQLNPMSKDFRLFGSVAGISPDTLDKIVTSCAAPYDGLVEVCDAWLDKCRKEKTTPTWNAVADILSLIGQDRLSHDIMQVYITGKLPIEVDMNALDVQGEVRLPSPPPPIPPHRDEGNEDTGSEVELMTVTSVMTTRQLPASRDTAMEEPPQIPEKLHSIMPAEVNEEPHQALPELPPKLPEKEQQRKPVPAKKKQNIDEVMPSLPPRPKK